MRNSASESLCLFSLLLYFVFNAIISFECLCHYGFKRCIPDSFMCIGIINVLFCILARHAVPATSFTVLGNVCKVNSVIFDLLIWDIKT